MMEELPKNDEQAAKVETEAWVKPEIASFLPAKAAEGLSYRPLDGTSNLT